METIAALFQPWMIAFYPLLFVLLFFLFYFDVQDRKRVWTTAFLALCSMAGIVAASLLGAGQGAGGLVRVVYIVAQLLAVISALNVAGTLAFSMVLPKLQIPVPKLLEDIILAGSYVAAGLAVLSASGADLSGVLATSAVVTGVVALSLQDTLGNVIGGMVLHLESAFKPGDWIDFEKYSGVIREIRWRQTTIETLNGDLVIIPNVNLLKSPVTIQGRAAGNTRFRAVSFNVYYDRAPGEVTAAVNKALAESRPPKVAAEPAPYCGVSEFEPNCVVYEVRYYLGDLSCPGATDSAVRTLVYYALSRAGIKLSIPSRSVVVSENADQTAERSQRLETERRLAALKSVEVFEPLTDAERLLLAPQLKSTPFAGGELITQQGAVADWLYVLYEGAAEIRLYSAGSSDYRVVKQLGPGDVLGEMGLLTGEARTATAMAVGEVRCYRLDRGGFAGVLAARPEIAEAIAKLLAARRVELAAARVELAGAADAGGLRTEQLNLLAKIRNFFKL